MPRRRANPLAWLALAVILVVLVVLVRAIGGGDDYRPAALRLARETAGLGEQVAGLRGRIGSIDRLQLFRTVRAWGRESAQDLSAAEELSPGKEFRRSNGYLVASLGLRAEALDRLEVAIRNALSDRDLQVAVGQLGEVMRDLVVADRSYQLFRESWPVEDEEPPAAQWVPDAAQASTDGITSFVRELRGQEGLAASTNLAVRSVAVNPRPTGKEADLDLVPFTRSLAVTIVVENVGNQPIQAAAIAAVLTSEADPEPQTVEGRLGRMSPRDRESVTLRGLEPTPGGPVNQIRISVGPAPQEQNTLDNVVEYRFRMRQP